MMSKFFVIEKNVPLPEKRPDPSAHYDVVPKMEVGDSILVKNHTQKSKVFSRAKRRGMDTTSRTYENGDIRVWRTK
tara:strand:- start:38 stop:265 length:228 start_codon:yes stop_codon:yes gene_type:complete